MKLRFLRLAAAGCLSLLLGACGIFGDDEEERLEGQRIAILALDRGLQADPAIANVKVRLPQSRSNSEWTHVAGNEKHAMYHLALGDTPERLWTADIGEEGSETEPLLAQPIVANGRVYTMDLRSLISAFDASSGKRIWRTDIEDEDEDDGFFGGGIAYADNRIVAATGFAKVVSLDATTGEKLWETKVPGPVRGAPTVSGDRVFVVTLDNQLIALGASDGRRLWTNVGVQEIASLVGGASPAVSGDIVIAPYSSGELLALVAEDGRTVWGETLATLRKFDPLQDIAQIRGQPVIDGEVVLAISHAGRMAAVNLEQGVRVWEIDLGGVQTPWAAEDYIFVLTNDSQVVAVRREDGRIRWVGLLQRFEDPEDQEEPIRWYGPVLAGERLIVAGSHGEVVTLSPFTGEVLGSFSLPNGPAVAPVVADRTLYFLMDNAVLLAMR